MSSRAICPYCGVGCHIRVTTQDNTVKSTVGDDSSPVNQGLLCPKGALVAPILQLEGRLLQPQMRQTRQQDMVNASWDDTLASVSARLQDIIERYGPDSVALYGSGQLDTEAWYLGNKLFKGYIGSNHVDSNSRLCMASAVAAYRSMLGSDGPPTCYEDIDHADCFLIAGSNMADAHPVLWQRIKRRRSHDPKPTVIVIDPRVSHTAQQADIHVALKPGSDIAFFHAIARIVIERNALDIAFIHQHTNGFEEYMDLICSLELDDLAKECGLSVEFLQSTADAIIGSKAMLSLYCMGLGQSSVGTAKNQAIINLHLLLGQIGKIGAGPFSLTGQPNAMGGRELGGLAQLLPAYRMIENADHRREMEQHWNIPEGSIHPKNGLTAVEMFQALESGRLKAIWIVCSNPLASLPNLDMVKRAMEKAELVIVQDCFETETTRYADVLLPAAQWIEKTGTMTNSERRVSRSFAQVSAPAEAKPDWWIFSRVAQSMGYRGFDFDSIEPIWDEYRRLTADRPCDMMGMTNERLQTEMLQWPCPTEDHPGTARRYMDLHFATPDGRAKFVPCQHKRPQEQPSAAFPLTLTTGRLASQWHTMTRTGKIQRLAKQAQKPYVEIHPHDAAVQNISEGECVHVSSARGQIQVEARITEKVTPGVVFMPFHWGDLYAPGNAINRLTNDALDPISKEPEYKACAVSVMKAV
jgi:ferredoxin-nitrate reductase